MKYNHMFDIAFSVVSHCEDPMECITDEPQLIRESLLKRIAGLTDDELSEALGHCDTYDDTDKVFHTKVETFVRFSIDTNYEIHARNEDEAKEFSINRAQHEIRRFMDERCADELVPSMLDIDGVTWMRGGYTTEVSDEDIRVVYVEGPIDEME